MWTCPNCQRTFNRKDQQHSCRVVPVDSLFTKRPDEFRKIYQKVVKELKDLGEFREEAIPPDGIYFKTKSTFLALKIKKSCVEVEFFLDHHENNPIVSGMLQTSKNRYVHVVPVDKVGQVNRRLITWIGKSYELVSGKLNKE